MKYFQDPVLQTTYNIQYYESDNDNLMFYGKAAEDLSNIILVVVNLDPSHISYIFRMVKSAYS